MRPIVSGIALILLAGCASAQPQPAPEWRLVDGAWVGPATTIQGGSAACSPTSAWHEKLLCFTSAASDAYLNNTAPGAYFGPRIR
jgi:hypothetical protein